jgi:histidyl-tRNA synthetase
MAKIQPVRGTHDLFGEEIIKHDYIEKTAQEISKTYGFSKIETPIFEFTEVFSRSVGEETDIVSKEMYSFIDKGGEAISLRPEGTAGVVRAFISEGLQQDMPVKFFYYGPMFRYERPQKGRQRQFHQLGIELIGVDDPLADIEVIACAYQILNALGLKDKITLEINSLGDKESRENYRKILTEYLKANFDKLSEDSKRRTSSNPLRVLDSKEACDEEIIKKAPILSDYLNYFSADFFSKVKNGLDNLGIKYIVNEKLVRGLDYYTHTAFEFKSEFLGSQSTVLGGGRYNGLVEQLGGAKNITGIGWAAGAERLAMLINEPENNDLIVAIIPIGEDAIKECSKIAFNLRAQGIQTDIAYSGNIAKRMKKADKIGAKYAVIIGEDEIKNQMAVLKNMQTGSEEKVKIDSIFSKIV